MKTSSSTRLVLISLIPWFGLCVGLTGAEPPGAPITVQGRISQEGSTNEVFDFEFRLFDEPIAGTQIGPNLSVNGALVRDGLFTVQLDFGTDAYNALPRFLEISVREGGQSTPFEPLLPRQELTPTAFAYHAIRAGDAGRLNGETVDAFARVNGVNDFSGTNTFSGSTLINGVSFTPGAVTFQGQPVDFSGTEANFLVATFRATNEAPFVVNSTNKVNLLNADLFDGHDSTVFPLLTTSNLFLHSQTISNHFDVVASNSLARFSWDFEEGSAPVSNSVFVMSQDYDLESKHSYRYSSSGPFIARLQVVDDKTSTNQPGLTFVQFGDDADGTNQNGGDLIFIPGQGTGTGRDGKVFLGGDLVVTGQVTAPFFSGNGTNLFGVDAERLGGFEPGEFTMTVSNNIFSGNNTFLGTNLFNDAVFTNIELPFVVSSSNVVPRLNADLFDGKDIKEFPLLTTSNFYALPQVYSNSITLVGSSNRMDMGWDLDDEEDFVFKGTNMTSFTHVFRPFVNDDNSTPTLKLKVFDDVANPNRAPSIRIRYNVPPPSVKPDGGSYVIEGDKANGTNGNGGDLIFIPGLGQGTGQDGVVRIGSSLVVTGLVNAPGFFGDGSGLNGVDAELFGGLPPTRYPILTTSNIYMAPQVFSNGVDIVSATNVARFEWDPNDDIFRLRKDEIPVLEVVGTGTNAVTRLGSSLVVTGAVSGASFAGSGSGLSGVDAETFGGRSLELFPILTVTNLYVAPQMFSNDIHFISTSNVVSQGLDGATNYVTTVRDPVGNSDGILRYSGEFNRWEISNNGGPLLPIVAGPITAGDLADGSVTTSKLSNESVTADKLSAGAVTTDRIFDGTIQREDLGFEVPDVAGNGDILVEGDIVFPMGGFATRWRAEPSSGNNLLLLPGTTGKLVVSSVQTVVDEPAPSVRNLSVLVLDGYIIPLNINDLSDGTDGQVLVVVGGGNPAPPTLIDSNPPVITSNFRLQSDWQALPDHTLTLSFVGGVWIETARSNN